MRTIHSDRFFCRFFISLAVLLSASLAIAGPADTKARIIEEGKPSKDGDGKWRRNVKVELLITADVTEGHVGGYVVVEGEKTFFRNVTVQSFTAVTSGEYKGWKRYFLDVPVSAMGKPSVSAGWSNMK